MPEAEPTPDLRAAEQWFVDHGLPYFVDDIRAGVRARLSRRRISAVTTIALVLAVLVGALVGWQTTVSGGLTAGATTVIGVWLLYAARALKVWLIARWALQRTFGSLGLLFPLATRALPMLLLFVTFLFINTEVWQVASSLDGGVLWGAVLLFALMAIGFLVVRLDEELDQFDDDVSPDEVVDHCADTPLAPYAEAAAAGDDLTQRAQVSGLQQANLLLMLLVAQAVQVLLLSLAVFGFFMVFGAVAIQDSVIESWIGTAPTYPWGIRIVSLELAQVATFLASFSGLYFTVYAITDSTYREQFFSAIMRELGQVVSARVAYRHARDH